MSEFFKGSSKNNHRRFPGVKGRRPDLKKLRIAEAAERKAYTDTLSPQERLNALDRRLGKNEGAIKERARLLKKISSI